MKSKRKIICVVVALVATVATLAIIGNRYTIHGDGHIGPYRWKISIYDSKGNPVSNARIIFGDIKDRDFGGRIIFRHLVAEYNTDLQGSCDVKLDQINLGNTITMWDRISKSHLEDQYGAIIFVGEDRIFEASLERLPENMELKIIIPDVRKELPLKFTVDDSPKNSFDKDRPCKIAFRRDRNSAYDNWPDCVFIEDSGNAAIYRSVDRTPGDDANRREFETANLKLSSVQMSDIARIISQVGIFKMKREYHAGVVGGSIWILTVQQGENTKSVTCENYFPAEIEFFAMCLDSQLKTAGLDAAKWSKVSGDEVETLYVGGNNPIRAESQPTSQPKTSVDEGSQK